MDIAAILQILTVAAQLLPEIEQVPPVIARIINGQTATAADAAAVHAAIQALETQVASREAAASTT